MATYVLAPAAVADLLDIARYSRRKWGKQQAIRYRDQLEQCFDALAQGKARAQKLPKVGANFVVLRCQRHCIFARLHEDRPVTIEAILHEKMDLIVRLAERLRLAQARPV